MSLAGNLRTMDLPEILQWIAGGRKTGTLHLRRRSVQKRITFVAGVIHSSWSNDPRESLGQFLVRERHVTEEQLFRALLRQEQEGRLLGAILVEGGLLDEGALRRVLRQKVEETIFDLFLWPEGAFEFRDGEVPENVAVPVELAVEAVLLEGARRVDEWARVRDVLKTPSARFTLPLGVPPDLDPDDRALLDLAGAGHSLSAIALHLRTSEYAAARRAIDLLARGLLALREAPADAAEDDPAAYVAEQLEVAARRLAERRYEQALEAYERVLALDRLNQHAKKGLVAVVEAKERDRQMRTVPRDKVPVMKVDLKELTRLDFDAQEGFVISRVNGQWDVQSILKLCPLSEEDTLLIFARLLERGVIEMR